MRFTALIAALLLGANAAADQPGRFDYYLLSLSWAPQYCASSHHDDGQECARPYAFVVHGLWPQNERGYPRNCDSRERVSDATIDHMLPLMPSKGLVIHEWHTHGACTGLGADDYFATVERAYKSIRIPDAYQAPDHYLSVSPAQLKHDFVTANPRLRESGMAVECSNHYLREVRICLTRDLQPRDCGADIADDCDGNAALRPVK
jgi:ribonuclease T2